MKRITTTKQDAQPVSGGSSCSRVLRLTLKRKWFDMIARGEKKEEYRTIGKWILSRLDGKEYDLIEFKNGYGQNVPTMEVEYLGWGIEFRNLEWGAGFDELVVIRLGNVISANAQGELRREENL